MTSAGSDPPSAGAADRLDHVIWIGGATGAGKTTVARRLAQRWGLRIYSSDNCTWVHRDRAIAAGVNAAIQFEELTPEFRATASPAPGRPTVTSGTGPSPASRDSSLGSGS